VLSKHCSGGAPVRYGARSANVELRATDESYFRIRHYNMAAGRAFSSQEVRTGQPVIVIGAELADKLLPGLDPIGKKLTIEGLPYQIVGVVAKQGTMFGMSLDQFAILPFNASIRRIMCASNLLDAVSIQAADPTHLRSAKFEVEALMRTFRRLRPAQANNFDLQSSEDALDEWHKVQRILLVALPGLVSISLVVGAIVIMNIMLMAVSERTREIGIRKALGARRRDILSQFVVEAATISLMGAILGIGAGFLLTFAVKALSPLPAAIAPWSIPAAMLLGIGVGVVAGAYPASRAARLDPITALQAE
jgi:putative ABC transport system permease protein